MTVEIISRDQSPQKYRTGPGIYLLNSKQPLPRVRLSSQTAQNHFSSGSTSTMLLFCDRLQISITSISVGA